VRAPGERGKRGQGGGQRDGQVPEHGHTCDSVAAKGMARDAPVVGAVVGYVARSPGGG
jgi:hypothetical protein